MRDTTHPEGIDVFIGVDVGKGAHHAVALARAVMRNVNACQSSALPGSTAVAPDGWCKTLPLTARLGGAINR